jgi:hypothetical protein
MKAAGQGPQRSLLHRTAPLISIMVIRANKEYIQSPNHGRHFVAHPKPRRHGHSSCPREIFQDKLCNLESTGSRYDLWRSPRRLSYCQEQEAETRHRRARRMSVESMWHVGRVFPCRVYINSNRRDSRI